MSAVLQEKSGFAGVWCRARECSHRRHVNCTNLGHSYKYSWPFFVLFFFSIVLIFTVKKVSLDDCQGCGRGERGLQEGKKLEFWVWGVFVERDLSQQKHSLGSVSIIPESFSFHSRDGFWVPAGARWEEGKKLAIDSVLQCWKVLIMFSLWR